MGCLFKYVHLFGRLRRIKADSLETFCYSRLFVRLVIELQCHVDSVGRFCEPELESPQKDKIQRDR